MTIPVSFNTLPSTTLAHSRCRYFSSILKLCKFQFQNNELTKFPAGALHNLKRLRYLLLDDNPIRELPDSVLQSLKYLERISLSRTELQHITERTFSAQSTHNLRSLNLAFGHIRHISTKAFYNVDSLEQLILNNNKLTTIPSHVSYICYRGENGPYNFKLDDAASVIIRAFIVGSPSLRKPIPLNFGFIGRDSNHLQLTSKAILKKRNCWIPQQRAALYCNRAGTWLHRHVHQTLRVWKVEILSSEVDKNKISNYWQIFRQAEPEVRSLPRCTTITLSKSNCISFKRSGNTCPRLNESAVTNRYNIRTA